MKYWLGWTVIIILVALSR